MIARLLAPYRSLAAAVFLLAIGAMMATASAAVSYIQGASQSGAASRNVSTSSFSAAQTAGNLNVVFIAWQGAATSLISLVDSMGNAYTRVSSVSYGATATQAVYYARNIAGAPAGRNTVTATFNTKVTNPDLRIVEYSGIDPTRPLDASGGLGAAAALTSSGAVATTNANDLLLASNFSQQSITAPGAGYTQRLKDQYAQIVEDAIVTATGKYTATAPQTKSGWFLMQLVAFRVAAAPPPVVLPNLAGQTQAAAKAALTTLGLVQGSVSQQSSVTVALGYVIGESPVAGTSVLTGSSVNLVVSSGPPSVTVPNLIGMTMAAASSALTGAGLIVGSITQQSSSTAPGGSVISGTPTAGTNVVMGASVNLVVSSGPVVTPPPPPPVSVPNIVGATQAAATSAITAAGLVLGSITQQSSSTIPAGSVISESPIAGTSVASGASVSLVVSSGPVVTPPPPPPVSVPNIVGATQAAATSAITAAGLVLGSVTQQSSSTVVTGSVISESPVAGTSVASGASVSLVVSSGPVVTPPPPPPVSVPNIVGATQAAATSAITAAGLVIGSVTQQSSSTVVTGSVISESPLAGASVASGASVSLVVSSGVPSIGASPYPASSILGGISWDESSKQRYAAGSDIWDSTWASDGLVYGVWGDGNGFSSPAKKQIGVSQLTGSPGTGPLTGVDVYLGSPSPRVAPCGQKSTIGGKPHGVIALPNGVIYMIHSTYDSCTSFAWLARSLNNGITWADDVGGLVWPDANGFGPSAVLQYGAGLYGALVPDNTFVPYVYIYGSKTNSPSSQFLARVPAFPSNAIETASNWSYYAGPDVAGNPTWAASSAQAAPVWQDSNYAESLGVTFNPALGRYIAYNDHGNACGGSPCERQVSLFDGPSPWGPWTTFDYEEQFDNANCGSNCLGSQEAVGWAMMQKWLSPDGLNLWVEYSSVAAYDSLNLIRGTMTLAPGSTITNLAISTGAAAVVDRLSLANPGNIEFIDSTARLNSIPPNDAGVEIIRLPRNDAPIGDQNYVSFTSTISQNICVGWNSVNAVPAWLSGWANTGQSLVGDVTFNIYRMPFPAGNVTLPGPASTDGYVLLVGCN